jgi:hypothetical protein
MQARSWWRRGAVAGLVAAGLLAWGTSIGTGARWADSRAVFYQAGYRTAGADYAGRSNVFGLIAPGQDPSVVRFAPARRDQPGGPETVQPADVGAYRPVSLAPGAQIWVTAPIADQGVTDYIRGIQVTPAQFAAYYRAALQKYGPMVDRGHMFTIAFDGQGRIARMVHYFSP